jgi:hypothetical protein
MEVFSRSWLSPFREQAARAGSSQEAFEPARFEFGHAASESRETVVAPPFIIFRGTLGEFIDETVFEQAVDRAVESAGRDGAYVARAFLDVSKNRISVAFAIG